MIEREYHTYLKLERGLSANSVAAYELDFKRLKTYMDSHQIDVVHASFDDLQAFVFDTFGGIMVAKIMNLFSKEKINPMIGAAGISAFPMSGRIVHKMALKEDPQNFLLMHSIGVNVSGQIASVIAGGIILNIAAKLMGG